jgi:long-chain acyl-CoA synthetase
MDGVVDVAVFGVDDPSWGQRVCAAYIGAPSESAVIDFAATALAPYKRPKTVMKIDAFPRSHSGKIDRAQLPSLFAKDEEE